MGKTLYRCENESNIISTPQGCTGIGREDVAAPEADVEGPGQMIVDVSVDGVCVVGVVPGALGLPSLGDLVGFSGAKDVGCPGVSGVGAEVSEPEVDRASVGMGLGASVVTAIEPVVTISAVARGTVVVGTV